MTHPISVLCIEDSELNMVVVQRIVESRSWNLISATSGEEGLELARQHQPNVILVDMVLPGMDGLETARHLKQDSSLNTIPIIAVTAYSHYGKQRCLSAGCAEYIL